MTAASGLRSWISAPKQRELLRRAFRPIPTATLARIARQGGTVGRIAGQGLRGRPTTVTDGHASGLVLDVGTSNPRYATGQNEIAVQDALCQLLAPGSVFYDVGANVGFFTLIASRLVGDTGSVVAFEPEMANALVLAANVHRNDANNVLISTRAVSSSSGVDRLWLAGFSGGHSLVAAADGGDGRSSRVETVSLDDFAATSAIQPPDVVKIDVEGAEVGVLEGMVGLLRDHRPVLLVEVDGPTRTTHDRRFDEIDRVLASSGYRVERIADSYGDVDWIVTHWLCRSTPDEADSAG